MPLWFFARPRLKKCRFTSPVFAILWNNEIAIQMGTGKSTKKYTVSHVFFLDHCTAKFKRNPLPCHFVGAPLVVTVSGSAVRPKEFFSGRSAGLHFLCSRFFILGRNEKTGTKMAKKELIHNIQLCLLLVNFCLSFCSAGFCFSRSPSHTVPSPLAPQGTAQALCISVVLQGYCFG